MNKRQATTIAHTLSNPSKMPCKGYSLPATACKTGSKLRKQPGTVCSKCYACKGMYTFPSVQNALQKRLAAISHPDWVEAMTTLISDDEYFRWHDSGDLQNKTHLKNIIDVCFRTPATSHWLPTKEVKLVSDYVKSGGVIPDNLIIRLSAPKIHSTSLTFAAHRQVKTCRSMTFVPYATGSHVCPAPEQNGECGDCRACWSINVSDVIYKMH